MTPEFSLAIENKNGAAIEGLTVETEDPAALERGIVSRYRLTLQGPDADIAGSGQLVVAGAGCAPPH